MKVLNQRSHFLDTVVNMPVLYLSSIAKENQYLTFDFKAGTHRRYGVPWHPRLVCSYGHCHLVSPPARAVHTLTSQTIQPQHPGPHPEAHYMDSISQIDCFFLLLLAIKFRQFLFNCIFPIDPGMKNRRAFWPELI